jgi:hypothetical protein
LGLSSINRNKSIQLNNNKMAKSIQERVTSVERKVRGLCCSEGNEGPQGPIGPQGVQGIPGTAGAVGPAGLEWQGSWVSETSYVADDAVGYDGASWFCILATSGTTTPDLDTTHWALLASQGAQGIQGEQGPTGPQGPAGTGGNGGTDLGYTPINKAGDTMFGDLILNADPDTALGAATKQYVDRIESGTYAEYVEKINNNALLPERYYAITDYQHKYCIDESNTSAKKVFKTVTSKIANFLVFDDDNAYDLNVGTVVTIEYLPPTYTGGLVVGNTTTVSEQQYNYYYRFANGMNWDPSILGVEISYSYARFATRTDLNNATVYDAYNKVILKPGGVLNTDVHDGTPYGDLNGSENFPAPVESIVLKAKSTNAFYENCYSLTYLNDELIYDFTSNIVYNDNKEQIGTRNGFIKRRFNKDINIDIDKDWRVQRYRRWMVPVATVDSDYRKKLLNIDLPNTNTYLAFQSKYLYTSELLNVNSTSYMYICRKIETTSLTAGITGSSTSFPIVIDGTGGLNSTESIVKFRDYAIFELDSFLEPVEVENCIIDNLENTIFINTDATQKGNLKVGNDINFFNSTFFGYPNIKCSGTNLNNVVLLDKVEMFGTNISLSNINALSYLYISFLDVSISNTIIGSLPYGTAFSGMGSVPANTPVRWLTLNGQMSSLKNCLIGCGVASMQLNNSTISGGGLFTYSNGPENETDYNQFKLFSSKLTNVNYNNYFGQNQTADNLILSTKQIRISESTNGGIIRSDYSSALYYQNVNVASPFNTVTKNYNYTTFLFETVLNDRVVSEKSGNYPLVNADSGSVIIFTASATLTIPTGLVAGFECTFVTLAGVTLTVVSTGNTLNNAPNPTGNNVLPPQLSFTLKRMIAANTFIATGNL